MDTIRNSQYEKMTAEPVGKLVLSMGIPTTISMLITNIYNMADTFYVSRISISASGATGIVFALMAVLQAFGFMFGHGAGSNITGKCVYFHQRKPCICSGNTDRDIGIAVSGCVGAPAGQYGKYTKRCQNLWNFYFDFCSCHDGRMRAEQYTALRRQGIFCHGGFMFGGSFEFAFRSGIDLQLSYGNCGSGSVYRCFPVYQHRNFTAPVFVRENGYKDSVSLYIQNAQRYQNHTDHGSAQFDQAGFKQRFDSAFKCTGGSLWGCGGCGSQYRRPMRESAV